MEAERGNGGRGRFEGDGPELAAARRLAAATAHDFNNFLTAILLNADALASRLPAGSELRPLADALLEAAERAAALAKRLRGFAGRQMLAIRPVDVDALLAGMEAPIRAALGTRIVLTLELRAGGVEAAADPAALEAAILALVANARDAMPDGGRLAIETAASPGGRVTIAVRDDGDGMTETVLARAIEPFFTTKDAAGFGLSLVSGFAAQCSGALAIHSRPGEGACVTLALPRVAERRDGA
jgi:signal transduction histidine kinase